MLEEDFFFSLINFCIAERLEGVKKESICSVVVMIESELLSGYTVCPYSNKAVKPGRINRASKVSSCSIELIVMLIVATFNVPKVFWLVTCTDVIPAIGLSPNVAEVE